MLVQCPNCKTTYKVSDEAVKGSSPSFRCSRCKHTFELDGGNLEPELYDLPDRDKTPQPDPEFTFPPASDESNVKAPEQPELPEIEPKTNRTPPADTVDDQWHITPAAQQPEEPFTIQPSSRASVEPELPAAAELTATDKAESAAAEAPFDKIFSIEPYRDQQASIKPFMTLLGLLVIAFSIAAAYYQAHPAASEDLVGRIPLVGSSVVRNDHLRNGVLLKSMQGSYHAIQGNRDVFVVTGTIVNQNPVIIRKVRLTGRTFNAEGKEIEQESMWIGNALSAKIVRGMNVQDIADLQKLEPLRNFEIPPGDSMPFTLVFLRSNQAAKNFTCAISAAEASDEK